MKYYAPVYYGDFKCIADKCKHNCCIGWEIDIDNDTYDYYTSVGGNMGKKLLDNIDVEGELKSFRLGDGERCPFLNETGLCEIIIELGEDKLCDICTDHPRFRNFYDDRVEIGVGLSCEAAARLIITYQDKAEIKELPGGDKEENICDDEEYLLAVREELFKIFTDREKSIEERIAEIKKRYEIFEDDIFDELWTELFFEKLEYMGKEMPKKLKNRLIGPDFSSIPETAWEQLLVYFLYRQLPDALYDDMLHERIAFCILSLKIIRLMLSGEDSISLDTLIENARLFSCEIEYSEDNMAKILTAIQSCQAK